MSRRQLEIGVATIERTDGRQATRNELRVGLAITLVGQFSEYLVRGGSTYFLENPRGDPRWQSFIHGVRGPGIPQAFVIMELLVLISKTTAHECGIDIVRDVISLRQRSLNGVAR